MEFDERINTHPIPGINKNGGIDTNSNGIDF
jgi:hypothetical protein